MNDKLYVIRWEEERFCEPVKDMYYFVDWGIPDIFENRMGSKKKGIIYAVFPFANDNVGNKILKKTTGIENAAYMTYKEVTDKFNELKKLSFFPSGIEIVYIGSKASRFELMDI